MSTPKCIQCGVEITEDNFGQELFQFGTECKSCMEELDKAWDKAQDPQFKTVR